MMGTNCFPIVSTPEAENSSGTNAVADIEPMELENPIVNDGNVTAATCNDVTAETEERMDWVDGHAAEPTIEAMDVSESPPVVDAPAPSCQTVVSKTGKIRVSMNALAKHRARMAALHLPQRDLTLTATNQQREQQNQSLPATEMPASAIDGQQPGCSQLRNIFDIFGPQTRSVPQTPTEAASANPSSSTSLACEIDSTGAPPLKRGRKRQCGAATAACSDPEEQPRRRSSRLTKRRTANASIGFSRTNSPDIQLLANDAGVDLESIADPVVRRIAATGKTTALVAFILSDPSVARHLHGVISGDSRSIFRQRFQSACQTTHPHRMLRDMIRISPILKDTQQEEVSSFCLNLLLNLPESQRPSTLDRAFSTTVLQPEAILFGLKAIEGMSNDDSMAIVDQDPISFSDIERQIFSRLPKPPAKQLFSAEEVAEWQELERDVDKMLGLSEGAACANHSTLVNARGNLQANVSADKKRPASCQDATSGSNHEKRQRVTETVAARTQTAPGLSRGGQPSLRIRASDRATAAGTVEKPASQIGASKKRQRDANSNIDETIAAIAAGRSSLALEADRQLAQGQTTTKRRRSSRLATSAASPLPPPISPTANASDLESVCSEASSSILQTEPNSRAAVSLAASGAAIVLKSSCAEVEFSSGPLSQGPSTTQAGGSTPTVSLYRSHHFSSPVPNDVATSISTPPNAPYASSQAAAVSELALVSAPNRIGDCVDAWLAAVASPTGAASNHVISQPRVQVNSSTPRVAGSDGASDIFAVQTRAVAANASALPSTPAQKTAAKPVLQANDSLAGSKSPAATMASPRLTVSASSSGSSPNEHSSPSRRTRNSEASAKAPDSSAIAAPICRSAHSLPDSNHQRKSDLLSKAAAKLPIPVVPPPQLLQRTNAVAIDGNLSRRGNSSSAAIQAGRRSQAPKPTAMAEPIVQTQIGLQRQQPLCCGIFGRLQHEDAKANHLRMFHEIPEVTLQCRYCSQSFPGKSEISVRIHVGKVHGSELDEESRVQREQRRASCAAYRLKLRKESSNLRWAKALDASKPLLSMPVLRPRR